MATNGNIEVVGIVSWGVDCAKINAPGSYTNVFKYIDFIKTTIESGNCDELANATEVVSKPAKPAETSQPVPATKPIDNVAVKPEAPPTPTTMY